MNINLKYLQIYQEMTKRNMKLLIEGGTRPDTQLQSSDLDLRTCLGLFSFYKNEVGSELQSVILDAVETFSNQVIYVQDSGNSVNKGRIHFTFMQIFKMNSVPNNLSDTLLHAYLEILEEFVNDLPAFSIDFTKLIAVPTGIVMCGYPTIDINIYRDKLRTAFMNAKLDLIEPYKADIVHSSLVRLKKHEDPQKLINFVAKHDGKDLTSLLVDSIALEFSTWRMWERECRMVKTFALGGSK